MLVRQTGQSYEMVYGALENKYYAGNGKYFASPLKNMNEQTVLVEKEDTNYNNNSSKQHMKYDDRVDSYFSTYDLSILMHNEESYLEGKIDSYGDVDYYSFHYGMRDGYATFGIVSEITIQIEMLSPEHDCDLTIYDNKGNQVGMAKDMGNGIKEVTLPNWGLGSYNYTIKVEGGRGEEQEVRPYRIKVKETRTKGAENDCTRQIEEFRQSQSRAESIKLNRKHEEHYNEQLEQLHQEQFEAWPEDERYTGELSVEELLEKYADGETLTRQETTYLKIFADMAELERAEAKRSIQMDLSEEIKNKAEQEGIPWPEEDWEIEIDINGNISVQGEMPEENRQGIEKLLQKNFQDSLWEKYWQTQAKNIPDEEYTLTSRYYDVEKFLSKATNGRYSWKDIAVDDRCQIGGLPAGMCGILNSCEANGRYEDLRESILRLNDYKNHHNMNNILKHKAKYRWDGSALEVVDIQ